MILFANSLVLSEWNVSFSQLPIMDVSKANVPHERILSIVATEFIELNSFMCLSVVEDQSYRKRGQFEPI